MASSVSYKSVKECSDRQRQIFIITIRPPIKGAIIFDNHYCHYLPPKKIIYSLTYLQMTNEADKTELLKFIIQNNTSFDDMCNELFIYFDFEDSLQKLFDNTLQAFQSFNLKKTVYLECALLEHDILTRYGKYFTNYKFVHYHSSNLIPKIPAGQYTKKSASQLMHTVVLTRASNNRLACQPWFKKFLSRVFSCGVYRLIQKSGTCFLNAVVNGILLSERARNLFLEKMSDFVSKHPETKPYISRPLTHSDMTSCRYVSGTFYDEVQYLYRLLYNSLCKSIRPFPRVGYTEREDVFELASQEYFSSNISGNGGFGLGTILFFLLGSRINFLLALEDENDLIFVNPKNILNNIDVSFDTDTLYSNTYFLPLKMNKSKRRFEREVVIYIPRKWTKETNIKKIESFNYVPTMGTVNYEVSNLSSKESIGHIVTLFLCDGVPKVYDSAENFIVEANWLGDEKHFVESYQDHSKLYYSSEINLHNFKFIFLVFTGETIKEKTCFELSAELEGTPLQKEYRWDVPVHRLYKNGHFTPYFYKLIELKLPIGDHFFDSMKNPLAGRVNDNYEVVKLILESYPDKKFTKYPDLAQVIFQIEIPEDQLEYSGITIKDYNQLKTIYKDLISYNVKADISDEIIEEAIKNGDLDIITSVRAIS
uniref:Uncharacterized protein n=1 Tax=viral metagenome TaxID=1070528 RepID=A0A6C0KUU0_9ZZZZ